MTCGAYKAHRKTQKRSSHLEDEDTRLQLLKEAYEEVLDATKHQDDKVGRLLTASAFWTAGSMALLGLGQGTLTSRTWAYRGENVGHLVIWLGICYIVLMCAASATLIASIMTPLRLAGPAGNSSATPAKEPTQIYFAGIAQETLSAWEERWTQQATSRLLQQRRDNYIKETHNLAVRASHKYARTNEAVAILQLMILFLMLLGTCSLWALGHPTHCHNAGSPCEPVELKGTAYWGPVTAIALWVGLTICSRAISVIYTGEAKGVRRQFISGLAMVVQVASLGAAISLESSQALLMYAVSLIVSLGAAWSLQQRPDKTTKSDQAPSYARCMHNVLMGTFVAGPLVGLLASFGHGYRWALVSLLITPFALTADAYVAPLSKQWDLQRGSRQLGG